MTHQITPITPGLQWRLSRLTPMPPACEAPRGPQAGTATPQDGAGRAAGPPEALSQDDG